LKAELAGLTKRRITTVLCKWGGTEVQSAFSQSQALVRAGHYLISITSKLQLLFLHSASVEGGRISGTPPARLVPIAIGKAGVVSGNNLETPKKLKQSYL
jgi:hypothetical protein